MTKSATAFKRSELHTLPDSGLEVELRKPAPGTLVMQNADTGDVPEPITSAVLSMISNNGQVSAVTWTLKREDLPGLLRFINLVVRAALVWPKVVDGNPNYEAGEIVLDDISEVDRQYIYFWAWPEGAAAAQSFRPEQNGHVEPAQPGETVQPATE